MNVGIAGTRDEPFTCNQTDSPMRSVWIAKRFNKVMVVSVEAPVLLCLGRPSVPHSVNPAMVPLKKSVPGLPRAPAVVGASEEASLTLRRGVQQG